MQDTVRASECGAVTSLLSTARPCTDDDGIRLQMYEESELMLHGVQSVRRASKFSSAQYELGCRFFTDFPNCRQVHSHRSALLLLQQQLKQQDIVAC